MIKVYYLYMYVFVFTLSQDKMIQLNNIENYRVQDNTTTK